MRPLRLALLLTPLVAGPLAAEQAPAILQITIEAIKPGSEAQYDAIERQLAEMCMRRGCPNDYLALESAATPKEVWWFTAYASPSDVERIARAYRDDAALLRELQELSGQKREFTDPPVNHLTTRRPDLGSSDAWHIGEVPFAVIAERRGGEPRIGAVFDAADGARFVVVGAATRAQADAAAERFGAGARVFAVHPSWSKPAAGWLSANPKLWARR